MRPGRGWPGVVALSSANLSVTHSSGANDMDDLRFFPITRLSDLSDRGEVDVEALTRSFLDQAHATAASLNSYVNIFT